MDLQNVSAWTAQKIFSSIAYTITSFIPNQSFKAPLKQQVPNERVSKDFDNPVPNIEKEQQCNLGLAPPHPLQLLLLLQKVGN